MRGQVNDLSLSAKENTNNIHARLEEGNSDRLPSASGKPEPWESPSFEEFDLCMEVTAYVHQWD